MQPRESSSFSPFAFFAPLIAHDVAISSPHVAGDTCCFNYSAVRAGFVERLTGRTSFNPLFQSGTMTRGDLATLKSAKKRVVSNLFALLESQGSMDLFLCYNHFNGRDVQLVVDFYFSTRSTRYTRALPDDLFIIMMKQIHANSMFHFGSVLDLVYLGSESLALGNRNYIYFG